MESFTLLTEEQLEGDKQIDVIKEMGKQAEITDFAILLGGEYGSFKNNKKYGSYWTQSIVSMAKRVLTVDVDANEMYLRDPRAIIISTRPVLELDFSSNNNIRTNGRKIKDISNEVMELEYGYYPQNAAPLEMQKELESKYWSGKLESGKNSYTTGKSNIFQGRIINMRNHLTYEYRGKSYIRVERRQDSSNENKILSNGQICQEGDSVWVEIQPVKWLVDKKENLMIAEKLLFSGIAFTVKSKKGNLDFETSDIKEFMNNIFAHDLKQPIKQLEETKQQNNNRNKNPYNFNLNEVSEQEIIKSAIESNVSVFLHGKPGCGKSDRVKQLDPDFIELNLSHLDPELLDGLAGEKDGKAVHIKPPWLEELEEKCGEEPDKIHILFLEELTNASQMMQSKAYGIALDKKVAGRWNLPENARVVAAGNELEDSLVANEIAEPLYDRFAHVNIETTAESWLEWAVTPENTYERLDYKKDKKTRPKIHPAIYSYISYKGEEALRTPYNREHPQPHADPRRWKMASDMLYASNNPNTLRAIVGEELTRDFTAFCQRSTLSIQDVINENYEEEDIAAMDIDEQLATLAGLVQVDESNMPKIRNFVKKLGPEMCRKFEVQWAGNNEERLEQIQEERMQENQINLKQHAGEEAKANVNYGILSANKLNAEYQMYLSKEENKGTETQEK